MPFTTSIRKTLICLLVISFTALIITNASAARRHTPLVQHHRVHARRRCHIAKARRRRRHSGRHTLRCAAARRPRRLQAAPGAPANAGDTAAPASTTPPATSTSPTTTDPSTPAATVPDPLTGDSFYVNPYDNAETEERALTAQGDTADAAQIQLIASQPEAIWLTSESSATTAKVQSIMAAAAANNQVPVLVTYNIPWRDCGGDSAGGASSPQDYEQYIDGIVAGIGQAKVVLIVEPDALGELQCLPSADQPTYVQLLQYAVQQLSGDSQASVYVDAGNPGWHPADVMASRLSSVIAGTRAGFALNVSNYYPTATDITYGTAISDAVGGAHFIIDTSRNGGSAEANQWCNAPGAGLGTDPTTNTGNALLDAELWIKPPGESDGECNGGPAPGTFWLSYALSLVQNQG